MAKPLYEAVTGPKFKPLEWTKVADNDFQGIKHATIQVLALEKPHLRNSSSFMYKK